MAILLDPKGQSITIKIKKIREEDQVEDNERIEFYKAEVPEEPNDNMPVNYSSVYGPHIK
jgi:hypothetical protein